MQTLRIAWPELAGPSLPDLLRQLVRLASRARQLHRQRRALANLDARLLRDIGLSLEQARQEAGKPFWRE